MTEQLSVAVIGAGIGAQHVEAYSLLPEEFKVACICDLNLERAKLAAQALPLTPLVNDFDAVLADPDIDIIDICLPPQMHVWAMESGLEAHKHVICEKPLASSVAEIRRIADLSARVGRQVFPIFQYRYGTGYRKANALKQAGLLGRAYVLSMETHWQRGHDYYSEPWRGTWAGEMGGVIVSHASHIHNLACHLMGNVASVSAFMDTRVNDIETEDCVAIAMRSEMGAMMTSSITVGAAGSFSRFRAVFEHVTMTSGEAPYQVGSEGWSFVAADPAQQPQIDEVLARAEPIDNRFRGLFADIHAQLHGQPDLYLPDLSEALHSAELISAIYHSSRTASVVSLPLAAGSPLCESWVPSEAAQ